MYVGGFSSISYNPYDQQSVNKKTGPDPEKMFSEADADSSGGVDETELADLASKIAEATGTDVSFADQFSEYDSDEDGTLSSTELESLLEANRPEQGSMAGMHGGERPKGPPPGGMPPSGEESGEVLSENDTASALLQLLEELQESVESGFTSTESDDDDSTNSQYSAFSMLYENISIAASIYRQSSLDETA